MRARRRRHENVSAWAPAASFDRAFMHDPICYVTTLDDLRRAIDPQRSSTAAPDCVSATFQKGIDEGGHDGPTGSLRFLEWCWDREPSDHTSLVDYAFLLSVIPQPLCGSP
jgi:hypothetical protein